MYMYVCIHMDVYMHTYRRIESARIHTHMDVYMHTYRRMESARTCPISNYGRKHSDDLCVNMYVCTYESMYVRVFVRSN